MFLLSWVPGKPKLWESLLLCYLNLGGTIMEVLRKNEHKDTGSKPKAMYIMFGFFFFFLSFLIQFTGS